ncbi:MAG: Cof-type HAD-IIB family hydrolase [Dehalococcoidales bacterium]|nr:Cof-type HAD-IIB family hydrolase [Dehalococcoidales bacterium]
MRLIKNPYKLLIVDIDGTLIGKDGTISAEDREALAKASYSGIQVSLSTGRVPQACLSFISQLALDSYHIFFDGALVSNPNQGREVYVQPLNKMVVRQAVDFAHLNDIYLELYSATHYFVEQQTWATDIHRQFFGLQPTVVDFTKLWNEERIIKGELVTSSPQEAAKARSFYLQFNGSLHFSWVRTPAYPGIDFINLVNPGVSKGKALEALAWHLGISMSEIIAIGDGANDISLLSSVGLAIAMENAPDEVKAVADYVTLDVDHNGLAAAIKRFLL